MVDYEREMTVKKTCKYDEYGTFEDLLFFFSGYVVVAYTGI